MIQEINRNPQYGIAGMTKSIQPTESEKAEKESASDQSTKKDTVVIGAKQETSVTYSRYSGRKLDASEIAALQEEAEKTTEHLRKLVEELILKQNKNYKVSAEDSTETETVITTEDIEAAQQAISEDGEFGVKAVSDRLVDFAIAVSGGDKSKLSELVSAIDEGFSQAKKALGGELPDICQQTYDETMRKLNEWAGETDS